MLEELFFIHKKTVEDTPLDFKRYLYNQIDWKAQALCIMGPRGVGKTTLLLQHYHEIYHNVEKCLYVSADNVEVAALGLFQIAKEYFQYGGDALIIDEIHKYPRWPNELKSILDTFKKKKVFVSGSSSLALQEGKVDFSRRLVYYRLQGLSFREYLVLKEKIKLPSVPLEDIFSHHVALAGKVPSGIPVLKYFKQYPCSEENVVAYREFRVIYGQYRENEPRTEIVERVCLLLFGVSGRRGADFLPAPRW